MGVVLKRNLGLVAVLALVISVLTGCAPETPHFVPGSKLVIGQSALLENLNTGVAGTQAAVSAGADLRALTMPAFYSTNSDGSLVANTTFGTVTSSDARTVTYDLVGNAKWSDGAAVTTTDFLLSWAAANNWGQAGFSSELAGTSLATVKELPTVAEKSLKLVFPQVTPDYRTALPVTVAAHLVGRLAFSDEELSDADATQRIVDAITNNLQSDLAKIAVAYNSALAWVDGQGWSKDQLVTSGPYQLSSATSKQVKLTANEGYEFGQAATVAEITINFYTDANDLAAELAAGKVDIARPLASATANLNQLLGNLQQVSGLQVTSGFGGHSQIAIFNRSQGTEFAVKPDGSNSALVAAKTAATQLFLPRAAIIDALALIDPIEQADSFVFPPDAAAYATSGEDSGSAEFLFQQAERAAELLTEAGFARRINVRVLFDSSSSYGQLEFGLLARYAKVAGINLENVSSAKPAEVLASGAWEVFLTDRLSMSQDLTALALASGSVTSFSEPEVASIVAKIEASAAPTEAQWKALDKALVKNRFGLPLVQLPNLIVNSSKLKNFKPSLATQQVTWGYWNWLVDAPAN